MLILIDSLLKPLPIVPLMDRKPSKRKIISQAIPIKQWIGAKPTLSKFFNRSIIRPSTSAWGREEPAE